MLKRLLGKQPLEVWVIKQVDADLLHLCGRATLPAKPNRRAVQADLEQDRYRGPVRMATGVVLNARLFQALVPVEALQLLPDDRARWHGRDWPLSQVPQRCWTFPGRLVAQADPLGGPGALVSAEDVSAIRRQAEREPPRTPDRVEFRPENELEDHALVVPIEDDTPRTRRVRTGREWRRDGD